MKKILIVDDEPSVVNMLTMLVEEAGYNVISAYNGQEALELARKERPDLIITDVLMPVMDGFAFYKELKKSHQTGRIPVLVLTARGQMEDTFKVIGVDDFVEKPSESKDLLQKISRLLKEEDVLQKKTIVSRKILIAGTYSDVVYRMVMLLKKQGHDASFVMSGPDLLSKVVTTHPEVIIMEVQMEGINPASDIIKAIRLLPRLHQVPVLLYSYFRVSELSNLELLRKVSATEDCQKKCLEAGATAYIGKFDDKVFLRDIAAYLK